MGTEKSNYKEFHNLWNKFEKEISISSKFKPNNIYGFAKYYSYSNPDMDIDIKNLKRKIERWKDGISEKRNFQRETINQLEDYYKFLNDEYFKHELLDDESYEHWFD